jgi:protein SCO1/2
MANKQTNSKFLMGITVAFLLPLSFYIIAKLLGKDKLAMPPHYLVERVEERRDAQGKVFYDTLFHQISDIRLQNQSGDSVYLNKDLEGKILIVAPFFARCATVCPRLTGNMAILQKAFKRNDSTVQLISISIDPQRDSFKALRTYAAQYKANPDHWWFLTGSSADIYRYLHDELKLKLNPLDGSAESLDHTPTLVLIDKYRVVRGYYNGLDTSALKKCADDIGLLSMEKNIKK